MKALLAATILSISTGAVAENIPTDRAITGHHTYAQHTLVRIDPPFPNNKAGCNTANYIAISTQTPGEALQASMALSAYLMQIPTGFKVREDRCYHWWGDVYVMEADRVSQ